MDRVWHKPCCPCCASVVVLAARVRTGIAPCHPTPPRHASHLSCERCSLAPTGWELEGTLCEASNTDTGVVWECPLLVPLDPVPRTLRAPAKQASLWVAGG